MPIAGNLVEIYGEDVNSDSSVNARDLTILMKLIVDEIINVIPEDTRDEETRKMDMIAWYDIDHG